MNDAYEIPLIAQNQTLTTMLAGVAYQLHVYWCKPASVWILDIADSAANPLVSGIAMTAGVDLLGQFGYLGIPGALVVQSSGGDALASPTFDNLGTTAKLYFVPFTS